MTATPSEVARWRRDLPFAVDHGSDGHTARIVATGDVLEALAARGATVQRDPPPPVPLDDYRMPDEGGARLRALADAAGERGGYAVLGHSVDGRPIEALWLGRPPESGAPTHRVLGAHHGDEWSSFEVALATAEALAARDGTDPLVTAALDRLTVWVVPYVNPDGVVAMSRWNARTVDLNRNYDYAWTADEFLPGEAPFSEPETRAVRAFGDWVQPTVALSLHSGASNFGWVWNHTTDPAEDAVALEGEALRYQALTTDPEFWVTNGAAWYLTHGDTNDWAYGRHGVWDSTIELTVEKTPIGADAVDAFVAAHLEAMVDQVTRLPDASGVVVDALTGRPVDAQVQLLGPHGPVGRWFRTEPATGAFHRLTGDPLPDAVEVRAPGYDVAVAPLDGAPIRLRPRRLDPRPLLPLPSNGREAWLPVAWDGPVTLSQPGHADRRVRAVDGRVPVDGLGPGAWTATRGDGVVHRHALLVADAVLARVDRVARVGDRLVVDGAGFVPGARAWLLAGNDRSRVRLPVLALTADRIEIDAAPTDEAPEARQDLWLLVAGEHLFVGDLTGGSPETWPARPTPDLFPVACATDARAPSLGWLLPAAWLAATQLLRAGRSAIRPRRFLTSLTAAWRASS